MTVHTVVDGNAKMGNEQLGEMTRKMDEIKRRVNEGAIDYQWVINELQRVVEGRTVESRQWKIWKTIKLGGFKTVDGLRKAMQDAGCKIGDWAKNILGKLKAATEETEVDLVNISVSELGFRDGATREQIYNRARELDLDLCPAEVGPQLRLQYKDQPNGEWILVAMEPITVSGGYLHVFCVRRGSELWLRGHCGDPARFWRSDYRWVFVRPRK